MSDINSYWKRVVSNGLLYLQKKGSSGTSVGKTAGIMQTPCWHKAFREEVL